jgi:hypothetical protein
MGLREREREIGTNTSITNVPSQRMRIYSSQQLQHRPTNQPTNQITTTIQVSSQRPSSQRPTTTTTTYNKNKSNETTDTRLADDASTNTNKTRAKEKAAKFIEIQLPLWGRKFHRRTIFRTLRSHIFPVALLLFVCCLCCFLRVISLFACAVRSVGRSVARSLPCCSWMRFLAHSL